MLRVWHDFLLQRNFEYFCLTSFLRSVLMSHSTSNSRVSEVSNFVLKSFMMSEVHWTAVENVVFFSELRIVIKLLAINMNFAAHMVAPITKLSEFATYVTVSVHTESDYSNRLSSLVDSIWRLLNMEPSLLLHQCHKFIYRSMANLLLTAKNQFTWQIQ